MNKAKKNYIYLVLFMVVMLIIRITIISNNKEKIYSILKDTKYVSLFKIGFDTNSQVYVDNKDINVFINEMRDISNIVEYSADAELFGEFKNDFRLLLIGTKDKDPLPLLYSIKEQAIIIRKMDVIPNFKNREPNVIVYQFEISSKVTLMLKKYEDLLSETGEFITSWPLDTY